MKLVENYTDGLVPELDPELLEMETISRCARYRDLLEDSWDELTEDERAADRVLVSSAPLCGHYWREDGVDLVREDIQPPLSRWWWWLDKIAEGSYPEELLPEWVR